jgi:hypothetical protein
MGDLLISITESTCTETVPERGKYKLNCWVLHPVARVSTNAFLKTTVRNNVFVLDFIVHYLLHVSAPIGGHLQVICTQKIYIKVTTVYINGSVDSPDHGTCLYAADSTDPLTYTVVTLIYIFCVHITCTVCLSVLSILLVGTNTRSLNCSRI